MSKSISPYLSRKIAILQFVCCVMVVVQHCYNWRYTQDTPLNFDYVFQMLISHGLCHCAVPFFFICSGYLMFRNWKDAWNDGTVPVWYGRSLLTRIRSVFIPYVLWCLVYFAFDLCWNFVLLKAHKEFLMRPVGEGSLIIRFLVDYFRLGWGFFYDGGGTVHFWYLRRLFLFILLAPGIGVLVHYLRWFLLVILVAGVVVGDVWDSSVMGLFFNTSNVFFVLGVLLAVCGDERFLQWRISVKKVRLFAVALTMMWLAMIVVMFCVRRMLVAIPGGELLDLIQNLLGVGAIWMIYDLLNISVKRLDGMANFCRNVAFFIYCSHLIFRGFFDVVINMKLYGGLPYYLTLIATTLSCAIGTGLLMKRWFPRIFMVLTGGR